jgi:hypothetical protein
MQNSTDSQSKYAPTKSLKTSVGRLENVDCIIPHMRHFVGKINKVKEQFMTNNKPGAELGHILCADFALSQCFLRQAQDGVSMNLLTYRSPNVWLRSDACDHGIGGTNTKKAVGWR